MWADVNVPGTPTYNGNYPTSEVVIYNAVNSAQLADFDQLAAMQNASNWQWYLLGMSSYAFVVIRGELTESSHSCLDGSLHCWKSSWQAELPQQ